jgi:hypothetical protein
MTYAIMTDVVLSRPCLYLIENHCGIAYQLIIADAPGAPATAALAGIIMRPFGIA